MLSISNMPSATVLPMDLHNAERGVSSGDAADIAKASRQFEAILVRQILNNARVGASGMDEGKSTANDIYRDLLTSQLADQISQSGELGFAKQLERELNRHTNAVPKGEGTLTGTEVCGSAQFLKH